MFGRRRNSAAWLPDIGDWRFGRNRSVMAKRPWIVPALGLGMASAAIGAWGLAQRRRTPYSPTSSDRLSPTTKTIVVNREPCEVYEFWRHFDRFPRFMRHLKEVSVRKDGVSHWKAYGPGGQLYEWDAEIVQNRPDEAIVWRSLPGGDVQNEGSVRFERAPGGRGTLVRVNLRYDPPVGAVGATVATLLGREPGQEVQEDLRRFKQVMETGEVVRSDASIHRRSHPARPDEASFRLRKPVPGAGPVRAASDLDRAPDDDRSRTNAWAAGRADADAAVVSAPAGGAR